MSFPLFSQVAIDVKNSVAGSSRPAHRSGTTGGRVFFLRTEDLDWIEAAGNYVRLHLGEEAHLFRETMTHMEARLDTRRFVRIHRSRIVNTERIKELQPWFNGEYVVVLHNGTQLRLSRSYREKLEERLGKAI